MVELPVTKRPQNKVTGSSEKLDKLCAHRVSPGIGPNRASPGIDPNRFGGIPLSDRGDAIRRFGSIMPQLEAALKSAERKLTKSQDEYALIDGDEILKPVKVALSELTIFEKKNIEDF